MNFSREIWTEVMGLKGLMKSVFRRRGILYVEGVRAELTGGWFSRLATANSFQRLSRMDAVRSDG
jgi:hypothetical protein